MKYIDIYNSVANPLDEDAVLDILAYAYSQRHSGILVFYSQLVKTTEKEYTEKYNPDEYDKFYATAFNKWKKGIVSLTKEEFDKLKERKIYDDRLIKLRNYLKTVPDVATAEEARKIMNQNFDDDTLNSAMKDYCWDSMSRNTDWEYVVSGFLNGKRENEFLVTHRLYLNVESIDIHTVLNELIQKCDEHGIPYYFKIDKRRERDDNLVVYSDTEKLPFYIKMLQEIAKKHPEVKARSKTPPVLTGKIDTLINFPLSFSGTMSTALVPSIASANSKNTLNEVEKRINTSMLVGLLIALPVSAIYLFYGNEILNLLFPNASNGATLLKISAFTIIFLSIEQTIRGVLIGIGDNTIPIITVIIDAVIGLILNKILIPLDGFIGGINGAAIGNLISNFVVTAIGYMWIKKKVNIKIRKKNILKAVVATLTFIILSKIIYKILVIIVNAKISLLLSVGIGAMFYIVLIHLFDILNTKQLQTLSFRQKKTKNSKKITK